jgi:serine/threonine-protein kinase
VVVVTVLIMVVGALLARRNLRLARGDAKGARRVALYVFALLMLRWLLTASHVPDLAIEFELFITALGWNGLSAVIVWAFYMALEPYVRRFWPETLIAWSRLLAGRFRDPLVGRDVLIGTIFGMSMLLLLELAAQAPVWFGEPPRVASGVSLAPLLGVGHLAGAFCDSQVFAVGSALATLMVLFVLRMVFRIRFLAGTAFLTMQSVSTFAVFSAMFGGAHPVGLLVALVFSLLQLTMLVRFGLLTTAVAHLFAGTLTIHYPAVTWDPSSWSAGSFLTVASLFLIVGAYGLLCSVGNQPLFADRILDPAD